MNTILIDCGGGLGNRLGALISGLQVAKICNLSPVINWYTDNSCECDFSKLFNTTLEVSKLSKKEILDKTKNYTIVATDKHIPIYGFSNIVEHNKSTIQKIKSSNSPIFYTHNKLPKYLSVQNTIQNLLDISPRKEIVDNVRNFVDQHKIDSNVVGIHIRKTDLNLVNEDTYVQTVLNNPNKRFFVCSDSQEAESKFSSFSNVIIQPKKEFVTKLVVDQNWKMKNYIDIAGEQKKYNVQRSANSVIEALQDMLILSHTNIERTSRHSSFLQFAVYYGLIVKEVIKR